MLILFAAGKLSDGSAQERNAKDPTLNTVEGQLAHKEKKCKDELMAVLADLGLKATLK